MPRSIVELIIEVGRFAAFVIHVVTPLIALFSLRRGSARNVAAPVVIACLLVIPFMILEVVNRRAYSESFPVLLFTMMWLMAFSFAFIFFPTIGNLRAGRTRSTNPFIVVPGLASLFVLAWAWLGLIIDQMPCFLGVPLCD